jgi:hypothetical protein
MTTNIININQKHQIIETKSIEVSELTKRLSGDEKKRLAAKLGSLPRIDRRIEDLQIALKAGRWEAPIFDDPDFPYYALLACDRGMITTQQFGTIQLYWSVLQYHGGKDNVIVAPIFDKGRVIPDACEAILETLYLNPDTTTAQLGLYNPSIPLLPEREFDQFFDQLRKLPPSEQYVFLVRDKDPLPGKAGKLTISQRLYLGPGYNIFCRNIEGGCRMIPSVGMMQTFLNVRYKENAVEINPVIGLSSEDDIRQNGLDSKRDLAVCFPGVKLPEEADTFAAPWYDFAYHDFYHAILASGIPARYRPLLIQVADIAQSILKTTKNPQDEALLEKIYQQFIDMEQTGFRPESVTIEKAYRPNRAEPHILFWRAVNSTIFTAMTHVEAETFNSELLTSLFMKIATDLPLDSSLKKEFEELDALEVEDIELFFGDLSDLPPKLAEAIRVTRKIQPAKIMSAAWMKRF